MATPAPSSRTITTGTTQTGSEPLAPTLASAGSAVGSTDELSDDGDAGVVAVAGASAEVLDGCGVLVGVTVGAGDRVDADELAVGVGAAAETGVEDGVGPEEGFADGFVEGLVLGLVVGLVLGLVDGGAEWVGDGSTACAVAGTPGAFFAPLCQTNATYPPSGISSDPAPRLE
jgi:hypothetical protein